jgi:ATP-dependent DNA helicase RecG
MKESHRVEFKSILSDNIEKEVVAFLNYREGGVIYIGIEDSGKVIGVENSDELQLRIKDRLKNNILPTCLGLFDIIEEEMSGGKSVIKIIVASGPEKPYYLKKFGMSDKGCYIRIGTAAEPMTNRIIENLFSKRTRNSIGRIRSNQQNLKFEQLRIYYEESDKKLNSKFISTLGLRMEDNAYNYVAFLMSDVNALSIKLAKYKGKNRVHLTENNEYGYCSIIKATKQVLDKIELENKTRSQITSKTRVDTRLWHAVAIREAVINAIVHNDYSHEVPPKFEIFEDRIEITSAGSLPDAMSQDEFFEGFSMPRNQEMMRIFKDLDLVEHLGSGVPRILDFYPKECFRFTENFLRMTFPNAWDLSEDIEKENENNERINYMTDHDTDHDTDHGTDHLQHLILIIKGEMSRPELMDKLGLKHNQTFRDNYLNPALTNNLIEMTLPEKPKSNKQKYRLTPKGEVLHGTDHGTDYVTDHGTDYGTDYVTDHLQHLISIIKGEMSRPELMDELGLKHNQTFRENYLHPALANNLIEMTLPEKPKSNKQKYRLTLKGEVLSKSTKKEGRQLINNNKE